MKSIETSLIDSYYALLKSLSHTAKLELITRLSQSIKEDKKEKKNTEKDSWKSLYGALKLDVPAEDFIQELKKDRKFDSKSIDL
jgi:hypothetical protein